MPVVSLTRDHLKNIIKHWQSLFLVWTFRNTYCDQGPLSYLTPWPSAAAGHVGFCFTLQFIKRLFEILFKTSVAILFNSILKCLTSSRIRIWMPHLQHVVMMAKMMKMEKQQIWKVFISYSFSSINSAFSSFQTVCGLSHGVLMLSLQSMKKVACWKQMRYVEAYNLFMI